MNGIDAERRKRDETPAEATRRHDARNYQKGYFTMPRNLPGKIRHEPPPGPEMTEAQFKDALQNTADDAARWRWLRTHWSQFVESYEVEKILGAEMQYCVDQDRKR